jgi:Spx/MgsR family transcriptional regulator
MYLIYGIPNCNTVKKAKQWFDQNRIPYSFHNYQKMGISPEKLTIWAQQVGWELLINRKGTTWRKNSEGNEKLVQTEKGTLQLLSTQTSIIKRPVIEKDGKVMIVGYDEDQYLSLFL